MHSHFVERTNERTARKFTSSLAHSCPLSALFTAFSSPFSLSSSFSRETLSFSPIYANVYKILRKCARASKCKLEHPLHPLCCCCCCCCCTLSLRSLERLQSVQSKADGAGAREVASRKRERRKRKIERVEEDEEVEDDDDERGREGMIGRISVIVVPGIP